MTEGLVSVVAYRSIWS